jgi:hypothetical protein
MRANNPSRPIGALAVLAKLIAAIAICFLLLSAVSTVDDNVQQEALTGSPRLHILQICKAMPSDVNPAALVSTKDSDQPNLRCFQQVRKPQMTAPAEPSIRLMADRSPPLVFHL